MRQRPLSLGALLALTLLGCGGGGGASVPLDTNVQVQPALEYNGSAADLSATPTFNATSTLAILALVDGERTLQARIPAVSFEEGATIAPSTANAKFTYVEEPSGGTSRRWTATAGSVKIVRLTSTAVTVKVTDLEFSVAEDGSANAAMGTFKANGFLVDVPID